MHVKYASRHLLYPVPNVLDDDGVLIAARAGRDMFVDVRALFFVLFVVPGRETDAAARDTVFAFVVRAVTGVRTRDVVRTAAVFRGVVFAVRDTVDRFFVVRGLVVVRETVVFVLLRVTVFSPRTAALAMPTLTMYAIIKIHAFFIP
jgi:hypothetical protein